MRQFILALVLAGAAFAQPTITGVSGTVSDGQSITLSGSGFGTKSPAAPVVWADFEEGADSIGEVVPDGSGTPHGWVYRVSNPPRYANDWSISGSTSIASRISEYSWTELNKLTAASGGVSEMYATAWTYVANAGPNDAGEGKGFRFGSSEAAGGTGPYSGVGTHAFNSWQLISGYVDPEGSLLERNCRVWYRNGVGSYTDYDYSIYMNDPNRQEFYVKLSTPGTADGIIDAAKFSETTGALSTTRAVMNRASGDSYLLDTWLVSLGASGNVFGDFDIYTDDVYLDITRARVEIGNASTFAACTVREIQIPSAWSSTSITVTVNQGVFSAEEDLFVFVVDADGNSSAGYPATIGGEPTVTPVIIANATRTGSTLSVTITPPSEAATDYVVWVAEDDVWRRGYIGGDTSASIIVDDTAELRVYAVARNASGAVMSTTAETRVE